jgi:hypothetical protein
MLDSAAALTPSSLPCARHARWHLPWLRAPGLFYLSVVSVALMVLLGVVPGVKLVVLLQIANAWVAYHLGGAAFGVVECGTAQPGCAGV